MSVANTRECVQCGRRDTRGFTKVGNKFVLRGTTHTAQRLNMTRGPAIWKCAPGYGCADELALEGES